MRYPVIILSVILIFIGVIMGFVYQDDLFGDYLYALEGLAIFVPLTAVIGLVALVVFWIERRIGRILSYSLVVSSACVLSIIVFEVTGGLIDKWKVEEVVVYVARAVPVLDGIKQKEGAYPLSLPTDLLGQPPELLLKYGSYDSTGSTFRFEYDNEPAEWAGGEGPIEFDSVSRKWKDEQ